MNASEFFSRFVKEMGYEAGSPVEGLRISFNTGVTINPTVYHKADVFHYHFDHSTTLFSWGFYEDSRMMVSRIEFSNRRLVRNYWDKSSGKVTIHLRHVEEV